MFGMAWSQRIYSSALLTTRKSIFQAHASKFSVPSIQPSPEATSVRIAPRCERKHAKNQDDTGQEDVNGRLDAFFSHIATLHPRTKRATHRMWAYRCLVPYSPRSLERVASNSRVYNAKDNRPEHVIASFSDVEHASGPILERLLELNDRHSEVVVVVYRWYGGVKLGSERWRCISGVASEALRLLEAGEVDATQQASSNTDQPQARVRKKSSR